MHNTNKPLKLLGVTLLLACSMGMQNLAYASNLFSVYSDGVQQGVLVRTLKLQPVSSFATRLPANGVATGLNNDVYLINGNHIYNYTVNGVLIKDMKFNDAGIYLTDIDVKGDRVYVAYKGSQRGVSVLDLGLNTLSNFSTTFEINSLAAGNNNDVYLTSVNKIYRYLSNGAFLTNITFSDSGLIYTDMTVMCGKIAVSYSGSQRGVSIRDQISLAQTSSFKTNFEIGGLVAGTDNDVYLSSGNRFYNYTLTGIQKQSVSLPQTTAILGDLSR